MSYFRKVTVQLTGEIVCCPSLSNEISGRKMDPGRLLSLQAFKD